MEHIIHMVRDRNAGIELVPEIFEAASRFDAEIVVQDRDRGPQYAIDWALAAAIALFIARPLFTSMLTVIGTEAGHAIVNAIRRQFKASKSANVRLYTEDEHNQLAAAHPDSSGDHQQYDALRKALGRPLAPLEITIRDETNPSIKLRLVFPVDMDDDDVPIALEKLMFDQKYLSPKFDAMTTTWQDALVYARDEQRWIELHELIRNERKQARMERQQNPG